MSSSQFPTKQINRLTGHNGQVLALSYSAGSGTYLLTGSSDRTIRLYNPSKPSSLPSSSTSSSITNKTTSSTSKSTNNPALIQTYSAHGYEVLDIAVSEDNDRFVSVGGDKTVFLWDVVTAKTVRRWGGGNGGHAGRVNCCSFGGEGGGVLFTGSFDATVKVWDTKQRSDRPIMTFSEAKDSISSLSISGAEILTGSVDGRVRNYDLRMGWMDRDVIGHPVTSLTTTKQNDSYIASTLDSTIRLLDKRDGKLLQAFKDPSTPEGEGYTNTTYRIRSTLAQNDSLVLSGSENGQVHIWDLLSGRVVHRLRHTQPTLADGKRTGGSGNGSGKGKDVVSGSGRGKDVVSAVAWNQLRKEWASAGGDGSVVIWGMDK